MLALEKMGDFVAVILRVCVPENQLFLHGQLKRNWIFLLQKRSKDGEGKDTLMLLACNLDLDLLN